MSSEETPPLSKKNYDEISFEVTYLPIQKRKHLIELITEEKWTIRAAARKIGIKHSTAKHILYLFRKYGKIVNKKPKPTTCSYCKNHADLKAETSPCSPQYILVPYPVYVLCESQTSQVPFN